MKVGIIGCGSISWEHVRRLSLLDQGEAEVAALCDLVEDRAEKLRRYINKFRVVAPEPLSSDITFKDYGEMLESVELDAVIVCTPHTLHYEHVMEALRRNLHVLVEKPMAVSLREAEEMKGEAEKRGLILSIGYQKHCKPEYVYARNMILGGELGRPHFIVGWLSQNLIVAGRFYLDPKLSGGGQVKGSGTHLIDAILWVTDTDPVRVKALMDRAGTQVDIYAVMVVELSNGALASIALSGGDPRPTTAVDEEVRFWCSRGGVFIRNGEVYVEDERGNVTKVDRSLYPKVSPNPDVNFIRTILGKEENLIPAICGVRATKLEELAYKDVGSPIPSRLRMV